MSDLRQLPASEWGIGIVLTTVLLSVLTILLFSSKKKKARGEIPTATGGLPVLGHALAYQAHPPSFLERQEHAVGPIFWINLAGRRMIVITGAAEMKQVASLPEKVISARQAIAEIGFDYTLGSLNVYKGTDWHKRILKDRIYSGDNFSSKILSDLARTFDDAVEEETRRQCISNASTCDLIAVDDLFVFIRRCVLRSMFNYLVGPTILNDSSSTATSKTLMDEFMEYQDALEDATAKAAVLPQVIAVPCFLRPVERTRAKLVKKLAPQIALAWESPDHLGPWLAEFRDENISAEEAAELTVGLLFAAHKNPAIGASQCLCFLEENSIHLQQSRKEAMEIWDNFQKNGSMTSSLLLQAESLRHCVLETVRMTAHSIGALRKAQSSFVVETKSGCKYTINRGTTIAIGHMNAHRDERLWGTNASRYEPNRWNKETSHRKVGLASPVSEYKLTTFSNGVHKCPGERLALAMMEIMLAVMLARDVKLEKTGKGKLPGLDFERATLAQRSGPVRFSIRNVTGAVKNDRGEKY